MKLECRRKPPIKSFVVKQSVSIHGRHSSSVSLERAFWNALKEIAVAQNVTTAALVSKIDSEREAANLSSAIRGPRTLSPYRERERQRQGWSVMAKPKCRPGNPMTLGNMKNSPRRANWAEVGG
jgi:predicted DNA-binding ribbon-helix-helix protein